MPVAAGDVAHGGDAVWDGAVVAEAAALASVGVDGTAKAGVCKAWAA